MNSIYSFISCQIVSEIGFGGEWLERHDETESVELMRYAGEQGINIIDSVNHALSTCGYPIRTLLEIQNFVGNGVAKLIERAVPPNLTQVEYEHTQISFLYAGLL